MRVEGCGLMGEGWWVRGLGLRFRVWDLGFWVEGSGVRVQG